MKRFSITSLAIIATVLYITACGTKKENAQLLHQVDSLKTVLNNTQLMIESQNSELEENINCINDIQNALDAISQKENELRNLSSEQTGITDAQRRAQLKNDIEALGRQLEENKKKIDNLNYALSKSKKEVKGLNEMVAKLQQQVEQRDKDIADLRAVIDKKDTALIADFSLFRQLPDFFQELRCRDREYFLLVIAGNDNVKNRFHAAPPLL